MGEHKQCLQSACVCACVRACVCIVFDDSVSSPCVQDMDNPDDVKFGVDMTFVRCAYSSMMEMVTTAHQPALAV